MAVPNLPKVVGPTEALVRQIAMDVGKDVAHYIATTWPEAMAAVLSPRSFRLSIRNHVYNTIMAAVQAADEGRTEQRLAEHGRHRRYINKLRKVKTIEELDRVLKAGP